MHGRLAILTGGALLLGLLLPGCSGGARTSTTPSPMGQDAVAADPALVALGAFDLMIDPATLDAELTVSREASATGDTFDEVGVTPALTGAFGISAFKIASVRRSGTFIEVDFETVHPFPAAQRPDLAVFNLKLWPTLSGAGVTVDGVTSVPGVVANADGYGEMWATTHAGAGGAGIPSVQPYVILNEDPTSATFDRFAPAGWNVFFPGQSTLDTVQFELPSPGPVTVKLYLTADYGKAADASSRQNPVYELPKFAGMAPWKVQVTELSNDLEEGNVASTASLQIDIWDWKHGASLGSDVTGAEVTIPAIVGPTPQALTLTGTGLDPTPLTATLGITNAQNATEGDYWGLVTVTDAATGTALQGDLLTPVPVTNYRTYQWFSVAVGPPVVATTPPTPVINRCLGDPLVITVAETFDGSASIAGSNPITTYEWDFDYLASTFTIDATGAVVNHPYAAGGSYTVALRVSDGTGPAGTALLTAPVTVNAAFAWQPAGRMTNNTIWERWEGLSEMERVIHLDPSGNVHLVWMDIGSSPTFAYTAYYMRLDHCADTWTGPTAIYTRNGQAFRNITSAMTSDGVLHVMVILPTNEYGYTANPGGLWTAPIPASADPGGGGNWSIGSLAAAGDGSIGLLCLRENPGTGGPNPNDLIPEPPARLFFTRKVAGVFTAPSQIGQMDHYINHSSGLTASMSLEGTAGSDFVAVWQTLKTPFVGTGTVGTGSNYRWNRSTAGTWGAQATLYSTGSDHDRPFMCRAPNGTIWLSGTIQGGNVGLATYDGAAWSPSIVSVASASGNAHHNLNFDTAGGGYLSIGSGTSGFGIFLKRFQQTDSIASIGALTPETISASAPGVRQWQPVTAPRGDGRVVTVWQSDVYNPWPASPELLDAKWE